MPKISTQQRQYYKSRIRSVIAQHPQISQVALAATLEADGRKLDRKYLGSLLNDIYTERSKRANTSMLNQALSAFQDIMMEISAVAWSIANDEFARKQDRVAALRGARGLTHLGRPITSRQPGTVGSLSAGPGRATTSNHSAHWLPCGASFAVPR
jgi:hypothetical protein